MSDYSAFFLMKPEDVKRYAVEVLHFFQPEEETDCVEIGDGNINYVFRVRSLRDGRSVIVKQADKRLRSSGRPLDIYRSRIEAQALQLESRLAPDYIPEVEALTEYEKENFWKIVLRPWPILLLIIISLGGIWCGFFTPTEAGGVGAFGAFLIVVFRKRFNLKEFWETLLSAGSTSGSVLILLVSASTYSRTLSMCGVTNLIRSIVEGMNMPPVGVILLFIAILMVLGCILDSTSILLLTTPLMCPIVADLGYDLVWFGLVMIIAIETGMITPPFGMNVFTVKSSLYGMEGMEGISVNEIFAGSMWFLAAIVVVDLICVFVPQVVMFLPGAM